jgi:hypothetical protein
LQELARRLEVNEDYISDMRRGKKKRVTLDFVDRLAIHQGLFDLDEIRDRSREWAQLTGARWPEDYQPREKGFRELRRPRRRRARSLSTLADAT